MTTQTNQAQIEHPLPKLKPDFSHRLVYSGDSPNTDLCESIRTMTERSLAVLEALHCGVENAYLIGNEIISLLFVAKAEIQDIQQTLMAYDAAQVSKDGAQ